MSSDQLSFMEIVNRCETESDAYAFLEALRWGDTPVCPHCGYDAGNYFLTPKDGTSRATRTGARSQRRVWKCKACRKQFSAITGTVMHGTKISIRVWLLVIFEMCCSKNGISAREVERKYNLAPKTAWHLLHRIRTAMEDPTPDPFVGKALADETFIGGKAKNRKKSERTPKPELVGSGPGRLRAGPATGKTIVLTLISDETGEACSRVIADVTGHTLRKVIAEQAHVESSHLVTDDAVGYRQFGHEFLSHEAVNHSAEEYVRYTDEGFISTNQVEGFFSQLKRSLDGTHHHVSPEHLHRYLAEFDFRYSTRRVSDAERMRRLVGQVGGRRLLYRASQSAA